MPEQSVFPGVTIDDLRDALKDIAEGVLQLPEGALSPDSELADFNLDSLALVEVMLELEDHYRSEVPELVLERVENGVCIDHFEDVVHLFKR